MSEKITVAFSSSDHIGSKLLEFFLFSKFSHTALIIDDIAFEARLSGGVKSVYKKDFIEFNSRYLELYDIKVTPEQKREAYNFSVSQLGKRYDILGVFAFPFRKSSWQNPNKWFCSEYNAAALEKAGVVEIWQKFNRISPRDLWILISNRVDRSSN